MNKFPPLQFVDDRIKYILQTLQKDGTYSFPLDGGKSSVLLYFPRNLSIAEWNRLLDFVNILKDGLTPEGEMSSPENTSSLDTWHEPAA